MQLGPAASARPEHQQPDAFSAVAEREHEQSRAAIASAVRIAHHGTRAVINLRLLTRRRFDHRARFRSGRSAQLVNIATDTLIAGGEAVSIHQVLPDRPRIAATRDRQFDQLAVGLRCARRRTAPWTRLVGDHFLLGRPRAKVGDHLYGRFCGRGVAPPARRSDRDAGRFKIRRGSFAPDMRLTLNAPQRPAQPPKRDRLLFLFLAQDIAHVDGG